MKVVLSWSGKRSKALAFCLKNWMPLMLPFVEPWMSEGDVASGSDWRKDLGKEHGTTNFGIICVTPENINEPWLLFEAGALAMSMDYSNVIPFLLDLEMASLVDPLWQFQARKVGRNGLNEVVRSINFAAKNPIPKEQIDELFCAFWPKFERNLGSMPEVQAERGKRTIEEIFEVIATRINQIDSRFKSIEKQILCSTPPSTCTRYRLPQTAFDKMFISPDGENDPIALLLLGGVLRTDFPSVYGVLLGASQEFQGGDLDGRRKAFESILRIKDCCGSRLSTEISNVEKVVGKK